MRQRGGKQGESERKVFSDNDKIIRGQAKKKEDLPLMLVASLVIKVALAKPSIINMARVVAVIINVFALSLNPRHRTGVSH